MISNLRLTFTLDDCKPPVQFNKLMVSHDLLRSTVTNQIAFDQRDSKSISNFEGAMDRCWQALVSRVFFLVFRFLSGFQIGNLGYHMFN